MRILIRTSKWAIWARRLAGFALPLIVLPVVMHRNGMMTSDTFQMIELLAAGIASLALLSGLIACIRLWFSGDHGWWRAIGGMLLAAICLTPFALVGYLAMRYPAVTDVSTDKTNPPQILSALTGAPSDLVEIMQVEVAFPNARTRRYEIDATAVFGLVEKLAEQRGWQVLRDRGPVDAAGPGQLNVMATTLVGWREEAAIRVTGDEAGASVAMRSASVTGPQRDLGSNGMRIEEFLTALDVAVTLAMRDIVPAVEDGDAEVPAPVE